MTTAASTTVAKKTRTSGSVIASDLLTLNAVKQSNTPK